MKTIVHICPTGVYSGLENVVMNIILLDKTNQHYYVSVEGAINDILHEHGLEHVAIKKLSIGEIKRILIEIKPDIVQCHDFKTTYLGALLKIFCKKKNIKLISHIHNNNPKMKKISLRSILFRLATPFFSSILMVSKSVYEEYIFKKSISKKYIVLPNIINDELILEQSKKYIAPKSDILFVGRLTEQKQPVFFIQLINEINKIIPVEVNMIGEGELHDNVVYEISKLNIQNNIHLLGFKKNPYPFFKNSKIFVLPSTFEGFGLVALEALSFGIPCVVSNVGGLPQIVDDNCGKLCTNTEEYIQEIKRLLLDSEYYDNKSEAAYKKFKQINQKQDFLDVLTELYSINN